MIPSAEPRTMSPTLASYYVEIRTLHVGCVALSGSLFAVRGAFRLAEVRAAHHRVLRVSSYVIDSVLLLAAVLLMLIVHQYPFQSAWLTAKVLLLVLYITLGIVALRGARTRAGRMNAFAAALLTFAFIVGVAITHDPAGWLILLR